MRNIVLYSAISLDGFIARPDGSIDWLPTSGVDYGYESFYQNIGVTLMGHKTYRQVLTFGEFPYKGKQNFVFTKNMDLTEDDHVRFINQDHASFIKKLKEDPGMDIWLVGGGQINQFFLDHGFIDRMILFIIPVTIGSGISLFKGNPSQHSWLLAHCQTHPDGTLEIHYKNKGQ